MDSREYRQRNTSFWFAFELGLLSLRRELSLVEERAMQRERPSRNSLLSSFDVLHDGGGFESLTFVLETAWAVKESLWMLQTEVVARNRTWGYLRRRRRRLRLPLS